MNALELERAIQRRIIQAGMKRIFERAYAVAKALVKPRTEVHDYWTQVDHRFSFVDGDFVLQIWSYFGPFGAHFLSVCSNERKVFDAVREMGKVEVKKYIPGEWEKWLSIQKLRARISRQEVAARRLARRKAMEAKKNLKPTAEQIERAANFEIKF
ncbi:MAG TPA: hypothetical protein VJK04_01275 [Candidatus Paceibacterota bacterium]